MHPNISENNLDFEVAVEIENPSTNISGPITVSLWHSAESEEYVLPDLHAQRIAKEFPLKLTKSLSGGSPFKRKLDISVPQREFWLKQLRGPGPAFANFIHSIQVTLKVSTFTSLSVYLPINFLKAGEANSENSTPVVQLEQ